MKKYLFYVYVVIMVIVGYFILKKKPATTSTDSSGSGGGILDMLGLQSTGNIDTTTVLATGLLNYQYNGQPLYAVYNKQPKASDSIGFTATGVAIKMANVVWSESQQQYIDKTNSTGGTGSGTGTTTPTGATSVQDFTYNGQPLYNYFNGVPLASGALGYLSSGTVILRNNVDFVNGEWTDKSSNGHLV